jgi:hypothetical protein
MYSESKADRLNSFLGTYKCKGETILISNIGVNENELPRGIRGPKRNEVGRTWRKCHNQELHYL